MSTMSGMDSLHVSVRADIGDVPELVSLYRGKYKDDTYKNKFPWVNQISEINNKKLIFDLESKILEKILRRNLEKVWLAVPEIIEWHDVAGFCYYFYKNEPEYSDIHMEHFLSSVKNPENIDMDLLKKRRVYCMNGDGNEIHKWTIYKCIYSEIDFEDNVYILSGGKWYKVATDFVGFVKNAFTEIPRYGGLPICNFIAEGDYNAAVAQENPERFGFMDQKNIQYGGGYSKLEFCDLISNEKDLIHVKKYGSSSVLSHLFAQGVNSAELFQTDVAFRDKVNEKLPDGYKIDDINKRPDYEEYRVVYAIVSDADGELDIPFFSKLSLRNACRRLNACGYRVALSKVDVTDDVRRRKKYRKKSKKSRVNI